MYLFNPPTRGYPVGTDRLWRRVKNQRGLAVVVYTDGRIKALDEAPAGDDPGVERVYTGGHVHTVTDAEANVLTVAGYGAYLVAVAA